MYKFLILVIVFLDIQFGANLYNNDLNQPLSKNELPEIEVFELNASGDNVVDSVRNYYEDGTLVYQMIYYLDGTNWMSRDAFDIKDLNMRRHYVNYKNSHDIVAYEHYKKEAYKLNYLFPRYSNVDYIANYLYFNAYLNSIGEATFENYMEYLKVIPIEEPITYYKVGERVLFIAFFVGVVLIAAFMNWVRRRPHSTKAEDTS